jgi:acetone carboxylase gamma subunit
MRKPPPKKNAECNHCLQVKPLLMPVGMAPGWPLIVWEHLCLECRTSQQMSRFEDRHYTPAYHLEHSPDPHLRQVYQEWLDKEDH